MPYMQVNAEYNGRITFYIAGSTIYRIDNKTKKGAVATDDEVKEFKVNPNAFEHYVISTQQEKDIKAIYNIK